MNKYPELTPIQFISDLKKEIAEFISKNRLPHNEWIPLTTGFDSPEEAILDQVMAIIFRLTQKPVDSLVPLKDLIDEFSPQYEHKTQIVNTRIYGFFQKLFSEIAQNTTFPIRYFPSGKVFERDKNTLNHVVMIENVKSVLNGTCPHCNGNYNKQQIDSFTMDQTITCEYCNYSIKAEWKSK